MAMLTRQGKRQIRGDYKRSWMSDDYFDLIVWYERSNAIHGFQLCYGKPTEERALTWLIDRGFTHTAVEAGEDEPWNCSPILIPDGEFPRETVAHEFKLRSTQLPKSVRNFVLARIAQFVCKNEGSE